MPDPAPSPSYYDEITDLICGTKVGEYVDHDVIHAALRTLFPKEQMLRDRMAELTRQWERLAARAAEHGVTTGALYRRGGLQAEAALTALSGGCDLKGAR